MRKLIALLLALTAAFALSACGAVDGENAFFRPVKGEHEWSVWFTSAYRALQLLPW